MNPHPKLRWVLDATFDVGSYREEVDNSGTHGTVVWQKYSQTVQENQNYANIVETLSQTRGLSLVGYGKVHTTPSILRN
jgi:hypothetical protein